TQEVSTATSPSRVRVGIYDHSEGIAKGVKALRQFLGEEAGFVCRRLTPSDIQSGVLSEVDVLIMPGGSGSAQAKNLGKQGLNEPADEVEVHWAAGQGAVMAEGSDATQ